MGRSALLVLVVACVALMATQAVGAEPLTARELVLTARDLPTGAASQTGSATRSPYFPKIPFSSVYTRSFQSVKIDKAQLNAVVASVGVAKSKAKLSKFMSTFIRKLRSSAGRTALLATTRKEFEATAGVTGTGVTLVRNRTLATGDSAVDLEFAIKALGITVYSGELFVQEGNALQVVIFASAGTGLNAADSLALAKAIDARMKAGRRD